MINRTNLNGFLVLLIVLPFGCKKAYQGEYYDYVWMPGKPPAAFVREGVYESEPRGLLGITHRIHLFVASIDRKPLRLRSSPKSDNQFAIAPGKRCIGVNFAGYAIGAKPSSRTIMLTIDAVSGEIYQLSAQKISDGYMIMLHNKAGEVVAKQRMFMGRGGTTPVVDLEFQ